MDSDTDSDTECMSQDSRSKSPTLSCSLRTPYLVHAMDSLSDLSTLVDSVYCAVEDLRDIDCSDVAVNPSTQQLLCEASSIIALFLSEVGCSMEQENAEKDSLMAAVLHISQSSVITRLFEIRQVLHQTSLSEAHGKNIGAVSCVDVVLTKVGDVSDQLLGLEFGRDGPSYKLSSLEKHWEATALQAALQLPGTWAQTIELIASDYASPAAIRLAIRLMYATLVLGCPIGQHKDRPCESAGRFLQTYICKHHADGLNLNHQSLISEDQTVLAMAIAVFAIADYPKDDESVSSYRPHTQAILLRQIAHILKYPRSDSVSPLTPLTILDTAQKALLRWGMIVPWCWVVWEDEHVLDHDVTEFLTVTWLYHLDSCSYSWEDIFVSCLGCNPGAACKALTTLMRQAINLLLDSSIGKLEADTLLILHKCCWGVKELFATFMDDADAGQQGLIQQGAISLCSLFVLLRRSAEELAVKDAIIAALAGVEPMVVAYALQELLEDSFLQAKGKFDAAVDEVKHLLLSMTREKNPLKNAGLIDATRQLLQFFSLVWQADFPVTSLCHPRLVSLLLKNTLNFICSCDNADVMSRESHHDAHGSAGNLPRVLLTAFAAMETCRRKACSDSQMTKTWDEQDLWRMALDASPEDVISLSALATYIVATAPDDKPTIVLKVAAWDKLRDFVLLVGQDHFLGSEELLALVVCSAAMKAMSCLLHDATMEMKHWISSSPWTWSLCELLQSWSVRIGEGYCQSNRIAIDMLTPLGKDLIEQIRCVLTSLEPNTRATRDEQLMLTKPPDRRHLVFWSAGGHPELILLV